MVANGIKIPIEESNFIDAQLVLTAMMLSKLPSSTWYNPKRRGKILRVPPKDVVIPIYLNDYMLFAQKLRKLNEKLDLLRKLDIQDQLEKGLITATINCFKATAVHVVSKRKRGIRLCDDYRPIN